MVFVPKIFSVLSGVSLGLYISDHLVQYFRYYVYMKITAFRDMTLRSFGEACYFHLRGLW